MAKYIISIDQSTQGTKALLFDETGSIMRRTDRPHKQIINEKPSHRRLHEEVSLLL